MSFKGKRYTTWTDEVLWKPSAVESGLTYGVYDNKTNKQVYFEKEFGIITSRIRAIEVATILNEREESIK